MANNKHENYEILNLIGYGLSKFDKSFVTTFGYKNKNEFYENMVLYGVSETIGTIKNRQDLFDPFFDNSRKGWWQKGDTYIHRKYTIDILFGNLDVNSYVDMLKIYLVENFEFDFEIKTDIKPIIKSQFKQLQKTGLEAETFFLNNYSKLKIFQNGIIEDCRLYGDGYDFQVEVNNGFFLVEVKGVRLEKGSIRLTKNEYERAQEYKNKFILLVVSNLNNIPKISIVENPLNELDLTRVVIEQKQIAFNTNIIEW